MIKKLPKETMRPGPNDIPELNLIQASRVIKGGRRYMMLYNFRTDTVDLLKAEDSNWLVTTWNVFHTIQA